jgi:hypothetical protein
MGFSLRGYAVVAFCIACLVGEANATGEEAMKGCPGTAAMARLLAHSAFMKITRNAQPMSVVAARRVIL